MSDIAQGAKFLLEPDQGGRVDAPHGLECDQLAALLVVRLVDDPHSTGPEASHERETHRVEHRPQAFGFRLKMMRLI